MSTHLVQENENSPPENESQVQQQSDQDKNQLQQLDSLSKDNEGDNGSLKSSSQKNEPLEVIPLQISSNSKHKSTTGFSFHENNPNHVITNLANDNEWECIDCSKKYKSYPAFYTHNKIKHQGNPPNKYKIPRALDSISKDRGRPKADTNPRTKFTDIDQRQHNLEDQIYEFLAKAGQNDDQENRVIRQYLVPPVNCFEAIPDFKQLEDPFLIDIVAKIKREIGKLEELCRQYEDFQFIDPMELSDPAEEEVNLSNLKYLFQHYKSNGLLTEYTVIAVFLCWVGKELRLDSFQEICYISLSYFSFCAQQTTLTLDNQEEFKLILEKNHSRIEFFTQRRFSLKIIIALSQYLELLGFLKSWLIFWMEILASDSDETKLQQVNPNSPIGISEDDEEAEDDVEGSEHCDVTVKSKPQEIS